MASCEYDSLSLEISLKRLFDLILAVMLMLFFFFIFLIIAMLLKISNKGKILYWSRRIGRNNKIFKMPKFRTMKENVPEVATHLLINPEIYITKVGFYLRKSSLDELPQIWSIFVGDMSFVGPRPALFNQYDLIKLRDECGVSELVPGITGWAQINGRDKLSIVEKVNLDKFYLDNQSLLLDMKIILATFLIVISKDGIKH